MGALSFVSVGLSALSWPRGSAPWGCCTVEGMPGMPLSLDLLHAQQIRRELKSCPLLGGVWVEGRCRGEPWECRTCPHMWARPATGGRGSSVENEGGVPFE